MPAVDPFSAAFVPMRNFDGVPSAPLPFAATLLPINPNTLSSASSQDSFRLPKPRKPYKDTIPREAPSSPYNSRHSVFDLGAAVQALDYANFDQVGSDEWMQRKVEQCVDASRGVLDLSNLGLEQLSTKISDLRDLVTLRNFSPRAATSGTDRVVSEAPKHPHLFGLPDGVSPARPSGMNARPFARVSSAPAAMAQPSTSNSPRANTTRTPSGLGARFLLPSDQSTIHEEQSPVGSLLSSPALSPPASRSTFARSKTGVVGLHSVLDDGSNHTSLEIMAAGNNLTSLPTALFELTSLTVLSIRGNNLERLPAAIGQMVHLKELSISNNRIRELPATILNLRLDKFRVHPNPLHKRPEISSPTVTRILGPLERKIQQNVPRLYDICLNLIISPRPPSFLAPLHDGFIWDREKGEKHPLLDIAALHARVPAVSENDLRRCLQAAKSASHASKNGTKGNKRHAFASLGISASPARAAPFPTSHCVESPDDAAENPYYSPCPSPRHLEYESIFGSVPAQTARRVFLHPAEERLEWRQLFGEGELPLRWRGCSPGCLAFLEADDAEEDGWSLEDFE